MSLPNVTPRNGYVGNAVTVAFSYTFRILNQTHLRVYLDDVLQPANTYTVSGVNELGGGTVTFTTAAPASLAKVVFSRFTPIDQLTTYLSFVQNDLTAAQAMESAIDKLTMILQELRALQVPFIDSIAVVAGAESLDVAHNLNTVGAILLSANADWNAGEITPVTLDANTITLYFANQVPGQGGIVNVMIAPDDNTIMAQYTGVNDPGLTSLTNRTGTDLAIGEVVTISTADDSSVVLADIVSTKKQLTVVLDEAIADLATGRFIQHGYAIVKTTGAVTRGHYLVKSATTKRAEDSGVGHGDAVTMPNGTFAIALTASGGGLSQVTALLLGGVLSNQTLINFGVTPSTQANGDVAAEGVSANAARGDHVHGMPAGFTLFAKVADQTLTQSSTTLQNLTSLVFPVLANKTYFVKAFLLLSAPSAASDFKLGWTVPTAATMKWAPEYHYASTGGASAASSNFSATETNVAKPVLLIESATLSIGSSIGAVGLLLYAWVYVGANAGNVQLQAAQNAAVAEDNKVLNGSILEVTKLN